MLSVVVFGYYAWVDKLGASKFPLVGSEIGPEYKRRQHFMTHAWDLFRAGSRMFPDKTWRVTSDSGELIVVPHKFADELRQNEEVFDRTPSIENLLETRYTGVSVTSPLLTHIVKADLTRNLGRINQKLSAEVQRTITAELPDTGVWTPVNIIDVLQRVVAIVSGFVFMGPELCRDEGYIHSAINFTMDVGNASLALKRWPVTLRPFMQYKIPELRTLREHKRRAIEFLRPIVRERKRLRDLARSGDKDAQLRLPDDVLQWAINKADEFGMDNDEELAFLQLELSLGAIHTTTNTAAHIIYDLVGHCPEVIPELRDEIRQQTDAQMGVTMSVQGLYQMKLLDSVMRESQRMSPGVPHRFIRRMKRNFVLSDGTKLPKHAMVAVNVLDTFTKQAYVGPDPEHYNPYRFVDWRMNRQPDPLGMESGKEAAYQFVSVTRENMWFGWGKHACPGRFFAANEIKLILASLLLDYDMKMPDDSGVKGRYPNLEMGQMSFPDPTKSIMVRRVKK
ncbi:cytochrome p450 [Colletotrichum truncatum]|uniref:Cytochrome p450 n=1 Tax=Colletotrichum truncatum TaxID=5467 RepID=A0ACC3Z2T3_COLTU|nr:cytochrome p450 [Colletotrichum truncatum]KAF6793285.1 cytochrome p450 [Colletotrichum truncatum]